MNNLFTIALMFKVLDNATAPVHKINSALDATGKGVAGIGKAATAATAKLEALQKNAEKLGESAQKLDGLGRPLATAGAISALGIEKTIRDFANLEDAQKQLRTTLMDQTGKVGPEFEKLNDLAEKLGTDLPGSTKDMVQMFIALREQGVQTKFILGGTGEAAAKFASLMKLPFAEAATHVAKFSESMGVADKDMTRFMDLMQRLKYASGIETGDLAYTFKYAGPALKLLGIQSMEGARDFSAAIGVLASSGIEGSTAGTNMAQALSKMAQIGHRLDRGQVKKLVAPVLNKYGIELEFFNAKGEFKGLRPMVEQLEKLKALNPQEQIIVLDKLFGDTAAKPLAVLLKAGVAGYDDMLKRLRNQADMETKIKEIMSGTKMQWETMAGTAQNLTAHVGGLFARLINLPGILTKLNGLFSKMDSFVLLHPRTAGIIAGIVLGITGLSLAGGALLLTVAGLGAAWPRALEGLTVLGKGATWATARFAALHLAMRRKWVLSKLPDSMFGDVIPGAAKAQTGIRSVIAATRVWAAANLTTISGLRALSLTLLTSPIGWIALAIGVAALVIYKYWKPISGFFKGLWIGLKEGLKGLEPAWGIFKRFAPILFPVIWPLKLMYTLVKSLLNPINDVGGKAENMGLRFGRAIGGILSAVLQLPARMLTAGANIIESLFNGMMSRIDKPIKAMRGLAQRLRNFLPFSPAKEGPLRDINRVRIVETIAESMKPQPLVNAMRATTAAAMIAVTPVSSLARSAASASGGAGMVVHYSPQIIIQGGGNADQIKGQVNEALKMSQREFEALLKRAEQNKARKGFA